MAKIYPEIPDDFHSSLGEYKIFYALKNLPDEWNIYYSVNWQRRENNSIRWGEADFLIFNPKYGIIVIEVKSGGINYEDGRWVQIRNDTLEKFYMKNPFKQADRSKFKIIEELDNNLLYKEKCFVDKAVWFPSISSNDLDKIQLPMEYNKRLILTEDSLENVEEELIKVYRFYNAERFTNLTNKGIEKIKNIIMPNFKLVPSASNVKNESDYVFYQLTREQEKVLDFIGEQNSVAIQGSAGTGKTFIAVEQAKRFSQNGKVLFLCFNKYLSFHLKNKCLIDNVDYYTLHSFIGEHSREDIFNIKNCIYELNKIDFVQLNYKYIIIDEAQDIDATILKILYNKCLENKIKLIIFYDENQLIFQNNLPEVIKDFDSKLTLLKNCRNTLKIITSISSIFNIPIELNELNITGVMPTLNYSEKREDIINAIGQCIDSYLLSGYSYEDIVILTLQTESKSVLSGVNRIGRHHITNKPSSDSVFFTTSKKFKGLESNIVIVVDFIPNMYEQDMNYKKNLYVSLSRARQRLDVYTMTNEENMNNIASHLEGDFNAFAKVGRKFKMIINKL